MTGLRNGEHSKVKIGRENKKQEAVISKQDKFSSAHKKLVNAKFK
jgi:hypothetical protein